MSIRQRNIPVTEKVATEAQTDIHLVRDPVFYEAHLSRPFSLLESRLMGAGGLVRAETDLDLLARLRQEINFFRQAKIEGLSQEELLKRLQWMESQVEGLIKRSLSIKTEDGVMDYYALVSDLQQKLDRQTIINNNYEPRLAQANARIAELEEQIARLRVSVIRLDDYKYENELYRNAFKQVSDIVKDPRRMRELEKAINEQITPLVNQYELKLDAFLRTSSTGGRVAMDPKTKLRGQVTGMLRGFERMLKNPEEMTIANVEGVLTGFLKEVELTSVYKLYEGGRLLQHQFEDLEAVSSASASMFQSKLQSLLKDNPNLQSQIDLSVFEQLQKKGTRVYNFNNVITIDGNVSGRTVYYQTQQTKSKQLINLLGRQFRMLLKKYPHLKTQIGAQLLEFVSLEVFDDANSIDEMERIIEVVKYQPEIIKVENVYQYNNDKSLKAIFHLKVMVKALLEELLRLRDRSGLGLEIDEGLLGLINKEIGEFVDVEDVLRVFRSVPKILEVERIVEKDLGRHLGYLTQAHPVNTESAKMVDRLVQRPVIIKDQVAVTLEKGVTQIAIKEKPVEMVCERVIEVPVEKEVIVERVITTDKIVEVELTKEVPFYETKIEEVIKEVVKERIVEVAKEIQVQVPVPVNQIIKEIVEVPRFEERLVEVLKEVTNIKEVQVTEQVPVEILKYVELEKIVNNFIKVPQIVEIKEQVPITITNTIEKPIDIIETIEKIVVTNQIEERLVEVPVRQDVALIQQVPKEYTQEVMVMVKGDIEERIVEVERIREVPIIHERLVTKEIEVERMVPVWMTTEKPVEVEVMVPYIQKEPELITCDIEKFIPYREEVPIEVVREVPVPIVIEKEVIKQVRVMTEKIIEKIVEVPRVVEVQKIVEKIVVVPRIIENIVHVPQIIEKIVERQVEVLKIVEIEKTVPIYLTHEVKEIVQEKIPYIVEKKEVEIVEKEKVVVMNVEKEVIKLVEVERKVPYEVIVEKEVPLIQEKIVDRVVTVRDIEIRDREVVIPFRHEVPVEIIQEKAVEIKKIIENILQVPQVINKNVILYETKIVPEIHKVEVEKVVEVEKEKVFTDTRNVIEYQVQYQEIIKEKLVKETEKIEILKPEPYIVEKFIIQNDIHESGIEVRLEKPIAVTQQVFVQVQRPVTHFSTKQIPKILHVEKPVEVRTVIETIKEVQVQGPEKIIAVRDTKPEVVQITEQVIKYLNQEVEKRVITEVPIKETINQIVETQGKTMIVAEVEEKVVVQTEPVYSEKVVERVILLPQILEVMKHIHEISEEKLAGVAALGVDVEVHTQDYIGILTNLQSGLFGLMASLKINAARPEIKAQITLIEQLLPVISNLIKFPTIIQVPKEVQKIVEREKVVLVPTKDKETIDRELASATLIEKLIAELKRVKSVGVDLALDRDIQDIFFVELRNFESMESKLQQFMSIVLQRFKSLGSWTEQHSFMLNGFLQERFLMAGIINEANQNIDLLKRTLEKSEVDQVQMGEAITRLSIHNIGLKNCLEDLVVQMQLIKSAQGGARDRMIEDILARGEAALDSDISDKLGESRMSAMAGKGLSGLELTLSNERLRAQIQLQDAELSSFRGGETKRNAFLVNQINDLNAELASLRTEFESSRIRLSESRVDDNTRRITALTRENEQLNRQLNLVKEENDRRVTKMKDTYQKQLDEARAFSSIISKSTNADEQMRVMMSKLEEKLKSRENEIAELQNNVSHLNFEILQKNNELDIKKRMGESVISMDIRGTIKPGEIVTATKAGAVRQLEASTDVKKLASGEKGALGQVTTSRFESTPEVSRLTTKYGGPAEQLKYSSTAGGAVRESRTSNEPSESGSSRVSGQQMSMRSVEIGDKKVITLRELMSKSANENTIAQVIVRVIEKIQEEIARGRFMLYTPENIFLTGYSPNSLDQLKIKLGDPILSRDDEESQVYMSPEALRGEQNTDKSCVFNIGVIWDELLHNSPYFKTPSEIESPAHEFKVRNNKLNPIFKNSLFEMLSKDPKRRIDLNEVKRRLSLQKFITIEEQPGRVVRGTVTTILPKKD